MLAPEPLLERILARFPGAEASVIANAAACGPGSLLLPSAAARQIACFLRDEPGLRLDYCSNVTGVDWPEREVTEVVKAPPADPAGGPPKPEQKRVIKVGGYLEAVYHVYSVELKQGPVVLRLRTANRSSGASVPSLTPVWRSCEFQEREAFDLFGIVFAGHPDLRRLLMWDEFEGHPMRKDYVEPDDYEWEPTAHDAVLAKAARAAQGGTAPGAAPA